MSKQTHTFDIQMMSHHTHWDIRNCDTRDEYNVENLKLSRDRHENCKTHPEGKIFLSIYFVNNKRAW